jgi:hypothetical protein
VADRRLDHDVAVNVQVVEEALDRLGLAGDSTMTRVGIADRLRARTQSCQRRLLCSSLELLKAPARSRRA